MSSLSTIGAVAKSAGLQLSPRITITKAGSFFKARFAGHAEFVFGDTRDDAEYKLLSRRLRSIRPSRRTRNKYGNDKH